MSGPDFYVNNTYILHEVLGSGGMGTVYRATHRLSGQVVALKRVELPVPAPGSDSEPLAAKAPLPAGHVLRVALAHEFRLLASLHHPHIVRVIDYGFDEQQAPFYTMELMESPRTLLEAAAERSMEGKIDLLTQLLHALAYLHRRHILHRDIKPSNVLISKGTVRLMDFGIAGVMGTLKHVAGTIDYMAPELFLGRAPSTASDLYAVGVLAFEMLTGRYPYDFASATSFLSQLLGEHAHKTMPHEIGQLLMARIAQAQQRIPDAATRERLLADLDGSGQLAQVIDRLIARAPQQRYDDAAMVIRDLGAALGRPLAAETVATRESFLQAAAFVGRDLELATAEAALARACTGRGSLFLIAGESGVGKSRLLGELRTLALVHSVQVIRAHASFEGGPSYYLWAPVIRALCLHYEVDPADLAVLRDIVPDLPLLLGRAIEALPALPPLLLRERLSACIARLLGQQRVPLVILLEDLHWAAAESLELLSYLQAQLARLPILIVGSYRDAEASPVLRALPADTVLKLNRFTDDGIAALSAAMLGPIGRSPELLAYLRQHTEGNALFIIEVVRALGKLSGELDRIGEQGLPESLVTGGIERLVARRLAALGEPERAVLELAAVAGRRIDLAVLRRAAALVDLEPWLQACANAGLLEAEEEEWQFGHNKIRERLLASLDAERLAALHAQIAAAIEAVYPGDPAHDGALAFHHAKAGHAERAYEHAMKAGRAAARLYALAEARAQFRDALSALTALAEGAPASQQPSLARRRVDTMLLLVASSYWAETLEYLTQLLTECIGLLESLHGNAEEPQADLARLSRLHGLLGRCRYSHGVFPQALASLRTSRELALRCGDGVTAATCLGLSGHILSMEGRVAESLQVLRVAHREMESFPQAPDRARNMAGLGLALVMHGEVEEGMSLIARSPAAAVENSFRASYVSFLSFACKTRWSWAEMVVTARETFAQTVSAGDQSHAVLATYMLARALAGQGDTAGALEQVYQARARAAQYQVMLWLDLAISIEAEVYLAAKDYEDAIRYARRTIEDAPRTGALLGQGICYRVWAQAAAALAHGTEDPAALFATSLQLLEQGENWLEAAYTRIAWARWLLACGQTPAVAALVQPAVSILSAAGLQSQLAEAQSLLAQVSPVVAPTR